MSHLLRRNLIVVVIVASVILGFTLPQVGLIWKNGISILLALLMFFSSLRIETTDLVRSTKSPKLISVSLLMIFVFVPLLAFPARLFFEPTVFAGLLLAFCSPSAIVTAFWSRILRGDVAFALVISALANIASIITIPATMLIALGATVSVDAVSMILTLSETVLLPIAASITLKRAFGINWNSVTQKAHKVEPVILALLIWGSLAPGVSGAIDVPLQFAALTCYASIALAVAFGMGYYAARRYGNRCAITLGIATSIKNAALALVLGLTFYSPQILTPLISNLVAQNILIVPLQLIFKSENAKV